MVREGEYEKADCALTISDRDLEALVAGQAAVGEMYQRGKQRFDGDVRVAQRLDFLKSLG